MKQVLVITGMGACKREPYQGQYVTAQVDALNRRKNLSVDYFYPRGKVAELRGAAKYLLLFMQFFTQCILSKKQYQLLHVHYFHPTMVFAAAYKLLRNPKVKIICTFHGSDIYMHQKPSTFYRKVCGFIDKAIFVSEPFRLRSTPFITAPSEVLCVGANEVYDTKCGITPEFDLLFVGNLNDNKGSDRLLRLIEQMPSNITVAVAGQGSYKAKLHSKSNVTCLGTLKPPALLDLFQRSRFLLNLSRKESFGLSMTEAMLCGTPVIATQTDGSEEQLGESQHGIVVPNDDQWLAQHLAVCVVDELSISDAKYNAKSYVAVQRAQRYRMSNIVARLDEIYHQINQPID